MNGPPSISPYSHTYTATVTLPQQTAEKVLPPRAGTAWIGRKDTWAAGRATSGSQGGCYPAVWWARPSASSDPSLGHAGLQASPSFLGPSCKASLLAEPKNVDAPLAFLVPPDPTQQGRCCSRGRGSAGNSLLAWPAPLGPALVQQGRTLAGRFEAELLAWVGPVSAWALFFFPPIAKHFRCQWHSSFPGTPFS